MSAVTEPLAVAAVVGRGDYRPVGSYARISKRKSGDGGGAYVKIHVQHADNSEYAARHFPGAPVAFYDDNMSAWDPAVTRPDWERMQSDIRAGNLRAVVAWHADRYTRQPAQLETMWAELVKTGTEYHTVRSGHVTNPLMLRIEGALAANDSDVKSEKIGRRQRTLAEEGKPHGGRRRFGYEPGMAELREPEASQLRDICERFLTGESLYELASSLNARGITGASGAAFTGPNLRKLIGGAHIAGVRVHKGKRHKAVWPGIISEADHDAIVAKLADPSRRTTTGNKRVHFLAGFMTCGACGAPVRGRPNSGGRPGRSYACLTGRHIFRPCELVERQAELIILARLSAMNAAGVFQDDAAVQAVERLELKMAGLVERRRGARARWADGLVSDESHYDNMAALDDREAEFRVELAAARAAIRPLAELDGMTGAAAPAAWAQADPAKRHRVAVTLFESLELVASGGPRSRFRPEDVRYQWRELPTGANVERG